MVLSSLIDPLTDGSLLPYATGQLGSLSFYFLLFASLSLHSLSSSSSLPPSGVLFSMCSWLKATLAHDCSFLLLLGCLLLVTWSSLSLHHRQRLIGSVHLSSYELRQLFLVSLVLQLRREMNCSPTQQSNQTSNPYT